MLRDNLVELIEPMRNSAGTDLLALGIYQQPASDDSLSCLENPRPEGAESSLTDNVTSPFPAEPKQREMGGLCIGCEAVGVGSVCSCRGFGLSIIRLPKVVKLDIVRTHGMKVTTSMFNIRYGDLPETQF